MEVVYHTYKDTKKCTFFWTCVIYADMPGFCRPSHISRFTVVSRAAKQSRTRDTTVCYYTWTINSNRTLTWSLLLKISYLMKKQRALIKPLKTIRYIRLALNKSSPLFPQLYPMECRPISRFLLLLLLRILIKEVGVEMKIFLP